MKKRLALAAALAFSIIPFTSFAHHLEPDESEIKKDGELLSTKLEDYDLFKNNLSDDILIAFEAIEGCDYSMSGYCIEPGADLSGAILAGANLSNIKWNSQTKWSNTIGLHEAIEVPEDLQQDPEFAAAVAQSERLLDSFWI